MEILSRQIARWQRQADSGELPDELYEIIAENAAPSHRRILSNLARVSRVVDDDGSIRTYEDFKNDWEYMNTTIGKPETCYLCGQHPILEHCVLIDPESKKEITVGNICVNRFIGISSEDQETLKLTVKSHKADKKKADFAIAFPNALYALRRYEGMMNDKKPLRTLNKTMVRRLTTVGYPGPKTITQWKEFIYTAEKDFQIWVEQKEIEDQEKQKRHHEAKRRDMAFQQEIVKRRNEWRIQAKGWMTDCDILTLNAWERRMVHRVSNRIMNGGLSSLKDGHKAFYDQMRVLFFMQRPNFQCDDPLFQEVTAWLKLDLNEWTRSFCRSVQIRIIQDGSENLSKKQIQVIESTRKRLSSE